jgi:hypothetical protein
MNIRKAVELADGFEWDADEYIVYTQYGRLNVAPDEPMFLDALAAQLCRQVDVLPALNPHGVKPADVYIKPGLSYVGFCGELIAEYAGPDRTENTINAIVESGVLERKENDGE